MASGDSGAETVHVRSLDRGSFSLLEQNYRYDLLSPETLLQKYVGKTVRIYRRHGGVEVPVDAEVLAYNAGPVLRIDGRDHLRRSRGDSRSPSYREISSHGPASSGRSTPNVASPTSRSAT